MNELCDSFPILFDGATGTNLLKQGASGCLENWILKNPTALTKLQQEYVAAGATMVLAPTFGINEVNLAKYGLENDLETMCYRLVSLTKEAVGQKAKVGGSLSPLGLDIYPVGEHSAEEIYAFYSRSAKALLNAGVDFFSLESLLTMQEARMALLAIKELCDKPIFLSMTVNDDGETKEDVDILTAMVTLQSMGVSAFGLNCCPGDEMVAHIEKLMPYAAVPVFAKPNSGKPVIDHNGVLTYPLSPHDFAAYGVTLAHLGVSYIGGCCGTSPQHIKALSSALKSTSIPKTTYPQTQHIIATTEKDFFFLDHTVDISKPIVCSEDMSDDILEMEDDGSTFVINVEVSHIDDVDFLSQNFYMFTSPLCIETTNIALLEAVARMYSGRLIIANKDEFDQEMLKYIIEKYGVIAL